MTKVLFFHSENDAQLMSVKVKDGAIVIGDKKFIVDASLCPSELKPKPLGLLKPFGMREPLYLLKWDSLFPGQIQSDVVEKKADIEAMKNIVLGKPPTIERNIITNVVFTRDAKNTPESLFKTESLKILGGMLRVKKEMGGLSILIFGLIVGMILASLMFYLKIIRI